MHETELVLFTTLTLCKLITKFKKLEIRTPMIITQNSHLESLQMLIEFIHMLALLLQLRSESLDPTTMLNPINE
jgi:pyruvate-formate lyase-activating enzyme